MIDDRRTPVGQSWLQWKEKRSLIPMKCSVIYELRKLLQSLYITLAGYIQMCSFQKCFVKSLTFGSDYYTYCLITYSLLTWKCVLFFFFPGKNMHEQNGTRGLFWNKLCEHLFFVIKMKSATRSNISTLFYRLCRLKACTMFSPPNQSWTR